MRQVSREAILREMSFAKKAARSFAEHPNFSSFSLKSIEPGCFLALRWGLGDDCVLVLKLDENHIPTNYTQLIRKYKKEK